MGKKAPEKTEQTVKGGWQNWIIGTGEEAPDQLLANPRNWRVHPKAQQEGLEAVLDRVGWVQQVIVNQRTGFLVDGHLRVSLAMRREEPRIPVVYVDLSPEEEDLILTTLDPIAGLAGTDRDQLAALLDGIDPQGDAALEALLDQIGGGTVEEVGMPELPSGDKEPFQEKTFILHDDQAEQVDRAIEAAKKLGPFIDSPNENGNGNALARICETYLTVAHGGS